MTIPATTESCACRIVRSTAVRSAYALGDGWYEIERCPLHAAAEEMLAALREALDSFFARDAIGIDANTYCLYCETDSGTHIAGCPVEQIRAAIASATQEVRA